MDKEQVFLQPAFVLHQRPYRNTSVIVDVFSRDYGRLSLIAKGVKQKKSALKSILQNFQLLNLSWVRRSDLGVLTAAEFQNPSIEISHDKIYPALYLNELIIRLLQPHDSMPELFDAYSDTLRALNDNISTQIILRLFEKQMLHSLGYEIHLSHEAENHNVIEAHKYYSYIPEHGFVETHVDEHVKQKRNIHFKGEHLIAFDINQIEESETLKTAHRLTHINLKKLLGDKPLKSRELYKAYKAIELA